MNALLATALLTDYPRICVTIDKRLHAAQLVPDAPVTSTPTGARKSLTAGDTITLDPPSHHPEPHEGPGDSVVSILETTAADGKNYQTRFYNLDAIIALGYRVNSMGKKR